MHGLKIANAAARMMSGHGLKKPEPAPGKQEDLGANKHPEAEAGEHGGEEGIMSHEQALHHASAKAEELAAHLKKHVAAKSKSLGSLDGDDEAEGRA